MRGLRIFGLVMSSLFAGLGLLFIVLGAVRNRPGTGGVYVVGAMFLFVGGIGVLMLLAQGRSLARSRAAVREAIAAIAARAFDAPAAVIDGFDGSRLMGPMGSLVTALEGANFTAAEGASRGAKLLIASHPSVAGRQIGEFVHVYSYVAAEVGTAAKLVLLERAVGSKLFSAVSGMRDVSIGDAAFDQTFMLDADPSEAAKILDAGIRARLIELRNQVPTVSQDYGAGRMTLGIGSGWIVLRWPGELSVDFAIALRDLVLDVRALGG